MSDEDLVYYLLGLQGGLPESGADYCTVMAWLNQGWDINGTLDSLDYAWGILEGYDPNGYFATVSYGILDQIQAALNNIYQYL
ncbi:MAG: hypothetical protein ACREJN_21335 [Nitrospiraceae bacterium]